MVKEFIDYYRILGVTFGASEEQLKTAYRNLAKRLHPDTYQGNMTKEKEEELTIRFKYVNEAYHMLMDKEKRAKYDIEYQNEQERLREQEKIREERRKAQEARRQERIRQEQAEQAKKEARQEMEQEEADEQSFRRYSTEEGFFKQVKNSYREVRADEKKMSFSKRHNRITKSLNKKENDGGIIIVFRNGIAHVGLEFIYQISKLGRINQDTVTKYIIRNRKTIAAVIIAGTIFSASTKDKEEIKTPDIDNTPSYTTITPEEHQTAKPASETKTVLPEVEDNYVLMRYYKVKSGDILSNISSESNTTIEALKKANNMTSTTIYENQVLKVPYYVKDYELQYFTESYPVGDKTLQEIADERETDISTLLSLNNEAIEKLENGTYMIFSYEIKVPKFITPAELREIKEARDYH